MTGRSSSRGADYVFQGIREFYKHRQLWKYAVPSQIITLLFNVAAIWLFLDFCYPFVQQVLDHACNGLFAFIVRPLRTVFLIVIWLTFLMLLSALSYTLFEFTGCCFFARMVARYEREVLHCEETPLGLADRARDTLDSCFYASGTVILVILLSIAGFFLPILMELAKAFAIGYRYAVSYAAEAGFNRNIKLQNLPKLIPSNVTASFGVTTYFLLLLPFVSLFLIPGFFIGGTIMVDREIP